MIAKFRRLFLRLSRPVLGLTVAVACLLVMLNLATFPSLPDQVRPHRNRRHLIRPRSFDRGTPVNFQQEDCELCNDKEVDFHAVSLFSDEPIERQLGEEAIQLYRHYTGHEPWPELQLNLTAPGMMPTTVHYLWCHHRFLGFQHYLALLSAVRLFQPLKLVFHYRRLPPLDHDMYNSWIIELKQSFPYVVFRPLPLDTPPCDSPDILSTALDFLQQDGGIFLGSNVIVSRVPRDLPRLPFWFAFPASGPARDGAKEAGGEGGSAARRGKGRDGFLGESHPHEEGVVVFKEATKEERATFRESSGLEPFQGVVVIRSGFTEDQKRQYLRQIHLASSPNRSSASSSSLSSAGQCLTRKEYDRSPPAAESSAPCLHFPDKPDLYPVDIMYEDTAFAQLARWLFYGTGRPMHPKTKVGDPIPRITHLIWFSPVENSHQTTFLEFYQYLTILSALYVAGFQHVYVHGNAGFQGHWWEDLTSKENVTFVHLDRPEVVFQQKVENPSHMSDVTRYGILHKYGGAYQDFEAMWTQRVPDWLLDYPCVATSDWAAYGDFPDGINPGVLLAKRGAPWLRYNLASHRYYVESNFVWNAILMSYRTFERHPDQLFYYRHLQVMCDFGICHPSWEPGFRRDIEDKRPTIPFDWRTETLAVHVTRPDPETSFVDPASLSRGRDMFAEIGRNIVTKSGRQHLLQV